MAIAFEDDLGRVAIIISDDHDTLVIDASDVRTVNANAVSLVECPAGCTSTTIPMASNAISMAVVLIPMTYSGLAVMNATMTITYVYAETASRICKTGC